MVRLSIVVAGDYNNRLTGQISAVTFFAKTRTKNAIKNLLGEPSVIFFREKGMSLIQKIREKLFNKQDKSAEKFDSNIPLNDIGNDRAECPYCNSSLDKMPGRKKKCQSCGNFIYVRSRPLDGKKILIREGQIIEVQELWAIKNGTHEEFLAEVRKNEEIRENIKSKTGKEPSENDIKWRRLNNDLLSYAREYQWGWYRNARLGMGDILKKEAKYLTALDTYLEVCFLDLNGPNNCGTKDPEFLREYPPFDPSRAFLAPGVLGYISVMLEKTNRSLDDAKVRFFEVSERTKHDLRLPLDVQPAWEALEKEF